MPDFKRVLFIILLPLVLILLGTLTNYITAFNSIKPIILFLGTPFVALLTTIIVAMLLLGKKQGYIVEQIKEINRKYK